MTIDQPDYDISGCPMTDRGNWMQLGNGRVFYPLDPRPEDVFIDDIAQSLSRIIRYNGHSDQPITVAQHCVQCVFLGRRDKLNVHWLLALLMHDASEAFMGDMIRPLKMHMPDFRLAEVHVTNAIVKALNIPDCPKRIIKKYDNLAWAWEKRDLFKSSTPWPYTVNVPDNLHEMSSWTMAQAEKQFMCTYRSLTAARLLADKQYEDQWEEYTDTRDWRSV